MLIGTIDHISVDRTSWDAFSDTSSMIGTYYGVDKLMEYGEFLWFKEF